MFSRIDHFLKLIISAILRQNELEDSRYNEKNISPKVNSHKDTLKAMVFSRLGVWKRMPYRETSESLNEKMKSKEDTIQKLFFEYRERLLLRHFLHQTVAFIT